ncbi:MAG TPA: hypothetical protein VN578_20780 [Candidatus Binatia bacterium]|jgi:hypothetical protein|nr:hypothetical protein [Candidatus Binatia bacterium]
MANLREYQRRSLLPLAGAAMGIYYFAVLAPLSHRAESLDEPLGSDWRKLATALGPSNAAALDFRQITNQLGETRRALVILEETRKKAADRLEPAPALRAKLNAPFQLVDYENERSKQMDLLSKQAQEQQVAVESAVWAGFPEHTADMSEPALLWPALAFSGELLEGAIRCKVSTLHSLEVPLVLTNLGSAENAGRWAEIPFQVEFTGPAESAVKFVRSLPLRAEEIRAAGLPPAAAGKTPLFLDRLIVKKQSPEKLDEVRVWLQVVGYVLRE